MPLGWLTGKDGCDLAHGGCGFSHLHACRVGKDRCGLVRYMVGVVSLACL